MRRELAGEKRVSGTLTDERNALKEKVQALERETAATKSEVMMTKVCAVSHNLLAPSPTISLRRLPQSPCAISHNLLLIWPPMTSQRCYFHCPWAGRPPHLLTSPYLITLLLTCPPHDTSLGDTPVGQDALDKMTEKEAAALEQGKQSHLKFSEVQIKLTQVHPLLPRPPISHPLP